MRERDLVEAAGGQPRDVVGDQLRPACQDHLAAAQRRVRLLRAAAEAAVHVAAAADAEPLTAQAPEIARLEAARTGVADEEARVDEVERLELRGSGVVGPVVVDRLAIDPVAQVGDRRGLDTSTEHPLGKLERPATRGRRAAGSRRPRSWP